MSEVTVNDTQGAGLSATNTTQTLAPGSASGLTEASKEILERRSHNHLPTAEDLDHVAHEQKIAEATSAPVEEAPAETTSTGEPAEQTSKAPEYVLKSDFDALLTRIDDFNRRNSQRL